MRHHIAGLLNCQIWMLQASQDTFSYRTGKDSFDEGDLPESPQTSDCGWELLSYAAVPSTCGSSAKYASHTFMQHTDSFVVVPVVPEQLHTCRSLHNECASLSIPVPENTADVTPHLHIQLTPQGSSTVSLQLTVQDQAASHLSKAPLLSERAQLQYQDQLRKAQQTLLPQVMLRFKRLRFSSRPAELRRCKACLPSML